MPPGFVGALLWEHLRPGIEDFYFLFTSRPVQNETMMVGSFDKVKSTANFHPGSNMWVARSCTER